jgi:hypothetical protein
MKIIKEFLFGPFIFIFQGFLIIHRRFKALANPSFTEAGKAAMNDPEQMKKIKAALEKHRESGNTITETEGIVIIQGGSYGFGNRL